MLAGTADAAVKTHTAGNNDTFWKLSKQYEVPLDDLMKANSKIDPLNIYAGLKITIPAPASKLMAQPLKKHTEKTTVAGV